MNAFKIHKVTFKTELSKLQTLLTRADIPQGSTEELKEVIDLYGKAFSEVVVKEKIGLSPKEGLRGQLRGAVHKAEEQVKSLNNQRLLADILQLRRNEKDFFLRKDLKYRDRFLKNFEKTVNDAKTSIFDPAAYENTVKRLNSYRDDMLTVISMYEQLGLSSDEGLHGTMRSTIHRSETLLIEEMKAINETIFGETDRLVLLALLEAIVIAIIITFLIYMIARSVILPLNQLSAMMAQARDEKNLTLRFETDKKDEIAVMGDSFNSMMEEFRALLDTVGKAAVQLSVASEEVSSIAKDTARGLDQQKREVSSVSDAVQQMKDAMQGISANTETTAHTARTSQQSAETSQKSSHKPLITSIPLPPTLVKHPMQSMNLKKTAQISVLFLMLSKGLLNKPIYLRSMLLLKPRAQVIMDVVSQLLLMKCAPWQHAHEIRQQKLKK